MTTLNAVVPVSSNAVSPFLASSMFDPLRSDCLVDFQVSQVKDGYVFLEVALPENVIRPFISLLDSLTHFVRFLDQKTKVVKAQQKSESVDLKEVERRKSAIERFHEEVCSIFDKFLNAGHSASQSLSLTNSALKEKNHPWASYNHC